jgi:hypothetical protein
MYFNRVEKAMQQLTRAGITSDLKERTDMALYYLKSTGEYDVAVREWEAKPVATRTWAYIKLFMSVKYAKENKQNKQTNGKAIESKCNRNKLKPQKNSLQI